MATICYDRYGRGYYCNNAFTSWGRWVLLGVILFVFILVFFLFSCITSRRRRKAGRKPFYGTGWVPVGNYGQPAYNPNYNNQQQAPQQSYGYNANQTTQPQGNYYGGGQNQSYFGGQQTGVSPPTNTYTNNYQPPPGPPPGKY